MAHTSVYNGKKKTVLVAQCSKTQEKLSIL